VGEDELKNVRARGTEGQAAEQTGDAFKSTPILFVAKRVDWIEAGRSTRGDVVCD
jgi:hypothetical protein